MALIALGVSGGIGAYKSVEVARALQKRGHEVVAVMTRNARRFVGPVTFEAITRHPVIVSQWTPSANAEIEHVALASDIALLLVAPATANLIGKFANGIADDFLSTLYLATRAPVLLAPAMNTVMWEQPAVRQNLATLVGRGVRVVEPGVGFLACGWEGKGRMAEPEAVADAATAILGSGRVLAGVRVLVTAGPTYEDIDPVRFVGNRSSGKMGFAVAAEADRRGAEVTLVVGPTSVTPPAVGKVVSVRSAADMHRAVMQHAAAQDVIVMAAAVADYAPQEVSTEKVTKAPGPIDLTLVRTPDILAELGAARAADTLGTRVIVGFAAETSDLVARAREKRRAKRVDLIVANQVGQPGTGFDADTNTVTLVADGDEIELPRMPKSDVARAIMDRVELLLGRTRA